MNCQAVKECCNDKHVILYCAKVVIIDTGCANVSSVRFAIERLGYQVTISKDPSIVLAADKLFLPGVGTASEAMKNLEDRDLIDLVKRLRNHYLAFVWVCNYWVNYPKKRPAR